MPEERNERLYIADMSSAVERILEYTAEGRGSFMVHSLIQDPVVRNLEILGEAVNGVT
jgi:uncharacterized protein with HEPN domain